MIVITGAAGFIGSCLLAQFNAQGQDDIIIVDQLNDETKKANIKNKKYIDFLDKEKFLNQITKDQCDPKIDCIIHMGACSSTTLADADYYERNNFEYSRSLAQWALQHGARFIYASSAATYGDGSCGYKDDEATIRQCKPLNYYGESKQKFDLWVLDNNAINKVVGLKFFNVFGPNEYHKGDMRSVVNKAYDRVVQEGTMSLFKSYDPQYADGEQKRDFVYIKDAVNMVMHFFDHKNINGIYNAGSGVARTWNDLAAGLFAAVGKPVHIEYVDMPENIRPRYQYFTQADMTKLKNSGYQKPFTPLEEGIKDYVSYLQDHAYL